MASILRRPVALALIGLAALAAPAVAAQDVPKQAAPGTIAGPVPWRVYPRDADGQADIPVALAGDLRERGGQITSARIRQWELEGAAIKDVPAGGPYQLDVEYTLEGTRYAASIRPLFVGDLWVLAGQSNMEGYGDLRDVTPPSERVAALGMDGTWTQAAEPLHWLVDSPDPVHSGDPATRERRAKEARASRKKGAGLGLPFAAVLAGTTGVPVGLVPCAHGGTSLAQWDPAKKDEGGNSLYGSMLRQLKLAGGPFKGMLWYQGESDANAGAETAEAYGKTFAAFIAAVRKDLDQPDLPVYFVQIGRYVKDGDPSGWNRVQDAQRRLPETVPNTAVVAAIDLDLDDGIHVGTASLKRLGVRLARIVLREQFGQLGAETPTFERVHKGPDNSLVVRFRGVNRLPAGPFGTAPMGMGERPPGFPPPGLQGSFALEDLGGRRGNPPQQPAAAGGLQPPRHIGGFSIRGADGTALPLIYDAAVGPSRDAVILRLTGPIPEGAQLWYGWGFDPYCNLTDSLDMAVPAFGPIPLDPHAAGVVVPADILYPGRNRMMTRRLFALAALSAMAAAGAPVVADDAKPVKLLIITGDEVGAHNWQASVSEFRKFLSKDGRIRVDVTSTPAKDLTPENLAKYDVLLLNYRETKPTPETKWSDANKQAFLDAVKGGKGLVVFHFASSGFNDWPEFEQAIGGGWRNQGYHGPAHVFTVKTAKPDHPIAKGQPAQFEHVVDELYSNSRMVDGNVVLATAFSDPAKPRGTGKDEPVIWVREYGKGRVYHNVLGHSPEAMSDPNFQEWMRRGVIWAATGDVK